MDPRCVLFVRWLNENNVLITEEEMGKFLSERLVEDDPPQTNDNRQYYRTVYLKSDHWRQIKAAKLSEVKECEICQATNSLDVHHRRYRSLYDVELSDLAILCRKCHAEIHEPFLFGRMTAEQREDKIDLAFKKRCSKNKRLTKARGRLFRMARIILKEHGIDVQWKLFYNPLDFQKT